MGSKTNIKTINISEITSFLMAITSLYITKINLKQKTILFYVCGFEKGCFFPQRKMARPLHTINNKYKNVIQRYCLYIL